MLLDKPIVHLTSSLAITVVALVALASCVLGQDSYQSTITGIVVDANGRPVIGADVIFSNSDELKNGKCGVENPHVFTNADGKFVHKVSCSVREQTVRLFVTDEPRIMDGQVPISAPFWTDLRQRNPRFAGLAVQLNGDSQVNLGKIPIQVWLMPVEVFVVDSCNRPFYRTSDAWGNFVVIVRDEQGKAVGAQALSISDIERDVRLDRGSVSFRFPDGKWTLELLRNWKDFNQQAKTLRRLAQTTAVVSPQNTYQSVRLVTRGCSR